MLFRRSHPPTDLDFPPEEVMIAHMSSVDLHKIRQLKVIGGFADGVELSFSAGLVCIIGNNGAGKTTVLELLRYALNGFHEERGRGGLKTESLVEANLGRGKIELQVEAAGVPYTITRTFGDSPVTFDGAGNPVPFKSLGVPIFEADIFTTSEIRAIAEDPALQLRLLDRFKKTEIAHIGREIRDVQKKLEQNKRLLLPFLLSEERLKFALEELATLKVPDNAEAEAIEIESLTRCREGLLDNLSDLWNERFLLRTQVAELLNERTPAGIRIRMRQMGDGRDYREHLASLINGQGIDHLKVSTEIAMAFAPSELAELARQGDWQSLATCIRPGEAHAVMRALTPERFLDLDVFQVGDKPEITVFTRDEYQPLSNLSPGEQCAAILPILLSDSPNPLIMDHPENRLDHAYVRQVLIPAILKAKIARQVIITTRSPSIISLAQPNQIFVLKRNGASTRLVCSGNSDQCRDYIQNVLEGGILTSKGQSS